MPLSSSKRMSKLCALVLVAATAAVVCGCGGGDLPTYPVSGKVVFEDGQPLTTGGVVLCESVDTRSEGMGINSRGKINEDGTYELFTFERGDGAVVGKHRVLVRAQRDADDYLKRGIIPRPVVDERFEAYETSGLELNVDEGENEFQIVVARPRRIIERPVRNE